MLTQGRAQQVFGIDNGKTTLHPCINRRKKSRLDQDQEAYNPRSGHRRIYYSLISLSVIILSGCALADKTFTAIVTDMNGGTFEIQDIKQDYSPHDSIKFQIGESSIDVPFERIKRIEANESSTEPIFTLTLKTNET